MDWNTKHRHEELDSWQKASINRILGSSTPVGIGEAFWKILEGAMFYLGIWMIALVALWAFAALLGFYWEMAESGFAFGRNFLRWLFELPR